MYQYNETTLPILKYLRWRQPLFVHPDFVKAKKKAPGYDVQKLMSGAQYPFLWPKNLPLKNQNNQFAACDAITGLSRVWGEFANAASSKIDVLSKTFVNALNNSYGAFLKADLFKELENQDMQGTLIFPGGEVICYDFMMESPQEIDGKLTYLISGNAIRLQDGRHLVCDYFEDYDIDGKEVESNSWHDFEKLEWKMPEGDEERNPYAKILTKAGIDFEISDGINENVMGMFDCVLVYHLFKKYAPIDEVISERERRTHADLPQVKTNQKLNYYDCTWYTTIIRTEGFSVRGHFRLQPCGKGKQDKKLIYIHEFQKHGYVRRARLILNETKEDNQEQ